MSAAYFSPWRDEPRPCWHCRYFGGMLYENSAAACTQPTGPRVRSMPANGCAFFQREPGADDEPGPPDAVPPASLTLGAFSFASARRAKTAAVPPTFLTSILIASAYPWLWRVGRLPGGGLMDAYGMWHGTGAANDDVF